MNTSYTPRYYLLYIPFLMSLLMQGNAETSYLIAWLGSFFIFWLTFTNKIKPTSPDVPLAEKIFKPLFLTQAIFAGYMACTSIFYFLGRLGYENFSKIYGFRATAFDLVYTADCQRYYVLGHAAFAHGLLLLYKSDIPSRFQPKISNWPRFFLFTTLICSPIGFVFSRIGGLSVLGNSIEGLALVSATIGLALSIPLKKSGSLVLAGVVYALQLLQALKSGFKEPVIVSVLMLGLFLYPFYKRIILFTFVPIMFLLFAVLPTYVNTFRKAVGSGTADAESAKQEAMKKVREDMTGDNLKETNWDFLTNRISEIGMFTQYKEATDDRGTYYGFQILANSAIALVPRVLWSGKPITEQVAMIRVIENGIVSENSAVSAKPQYIVDGYLSGGMVGVWLSLFFYGLMAQFFSNACERYFGGYFFGTVFVCTGVFRFMWRGNCFEFIFNNMLYGYLTMLLVFVALRTLGILTEKKVAPVMVRAEAEAVEA